MVNEKAAFATTAKNLFYKFCFCLGLGTASYYSYAQVNHWVKGDDATVTSSVHQASSFQQKVQSLGEYESLTPEQHAAEMKRVMQAGTFFQNPKASVDVNTVKPLIVAAPAVDAALSGEAPPATDAVAATSPSPSEEKKEGESAEKTADATNENPQPGQGSIPYAQPLMANGMPVPYAMLAQQLGPHAQPEAGAQAATETAQLPANSNSNGQGVGNAVGMPAGFNSGSVPVPVGSTSVGATNYNASNGFYSGSYSDATSLSTQDLAALTSPMQAAFQDQQLIVNGTVCAETVRASCTKQNDVSIHSLRWGTEEGLNPAVTFAVKAASGTTPVQFDVKFKIQDYTLKEQTVTIASKPSEILVHTESRNSKTYKVYEFKFADTTVRSDDALTQMQASLVYEVTTAGLVMTDDSKFSFARGSVKTLNSVWSPTEPNRAPAQNEVYFVADELSYSMSLQKSP